MIDATFAELSSIPALCRCTGAADRGSAVRLLYGRLAVPPIVLPNATAASAPGRVHSLGRFADDDLRAALAAALPPGLRGSLRDGFEWYACRGAFFHNDAHYGDVLFGAWCVAGPPRELVFARAGLRVPAGPGDWVLFDPFEPHAVIDEGARDYRRERYDGALPSVFVGFEVRLDPAACDAFGIGPARLGAPLLSSSVAINAETGTAG